MQDDGQLIGGFRLLEMWKSGSGGSAAVYRAVAEAPILPNVPIGTVVSLRVRSVRGDEARYALLERRATELSLLRHPNVARCFGCFRVRRAERDAFAVVFEVFKGEILQDRIQRGHGGLGAETALTVAFGILDALEYMSGHGVVPHGLTSGNILLTAGDAPKLIGIDELRDGERSDYTAPECVDPTFGGDEKSCVFSFGVCLNLLLTGSVPTTDRTGTVAGKLLSGVSEILARALSPNRLDRFAHFGDVRMALRRVRYRELRTGSGTWRLLSFLGKDETGETFRARDTKTDSFVTVRCFFKPVPAESLADLKGVIDSVPFRGTEGIAAVVLPDSPEGLRPFAGNEALPPANVEPTAVSSEGDSDKDDETLETQVVCGRRFWCQWLQECALWARSHGIISDQ